MARVGATAARARVRFGAALALTGGLLMGFALAVPAATAAPNGEAVGWGHHHWTPTTASATTTTIVDGNGANVSGPYDPYGVGLPSGNGNGNGNANGKPCAGCVGNADGKNPPGQMPNGSDPNHGYECDLNHGVGRTNPAHSGCDPGATTSTTAPTTTTIGETTTTAAPTTTTSVVETTTTTAGGTTTTTAGSSVLGEEITRGVQGDALARTGGFAGAAFALGLLLLVGGAALMMSDRRLLTPKSNGERVDPA